MNKQLFLIINLTLLFALPITAQDWERVKANPENLWGEGWGVTVNEADNNALNDLISKISVQVSGNTKQHDSEEVTNEGVDTHTSFDAVINTYSQATLTNTERIIVKNEPDAHVGRWIKRSEVNRIFESRKQKALDYVESAIKAKEKGKIDVAIKDFYWALVLVNSLQYPNEAQYVDENGKKQTLTQWIPHQMDEIFSNIDWKVVKRDEMDVELAITHQGNPVSSIDYTYFDGRDWSNIYSAKDGCGILELAPGNVSENYQLKVEYEYRGEAHIDRDVENVMKVSKSRALRNAYFNVKSETSALRTQTEATATNATYNLPVLTNDVAAYEVTMKRVVDAITTKEFNNLQNLFTDDGYTIFNELLKYGNAKVVGLPEYTYYNIGDGVVARGLQMAFSFKNGVRKSFVEDVVFTFDKERKIENVSFGLGEVAERDILGKGVWPQEARMAIMQFLENYQTAYALKRLDYIETVFDDDAVIITGTVAYRPTSQTTDVNNMMQLDNKIVKYNRYDKRSYLKKLAQSFASKEYINLRFANNDVRKLGKGGEVYAIQISQEYYSSNYGDKGYLFLMVDINDPKHPTIKVRTWQPEKDPNFGLYGPEDFN